jgi:hypothetical protein
MEEGVLFKKMLKLIRKIAVKNNATALKGASRRK